MSNKWEQHKLIGELETYAMDLDDAHRERMLDILHRLQQLIGNVEKNGRVFPNELIQQMVDKLG